MPRPRLELAEEDEPLETEAGPVEPDLPHRPRTVEVPSATQAVAIIEGTRRKLSDLPVAPKHLNPIAVVCLYTLYGLDTTEISIATGLNLDQINRIRMSNEYGIVQGSVVAAVMEAETGEVKDYIRKGAQKAAAKVDAFVSHPNADIALRAARDVLDRAGLRPADVVDHRHRMDVGLVIEVVDRKRDQDRPIIDVGG